MAKLILMQGLPASGKSTKAEEIIKESGNCVRINRDLLREMLHFNKWSGHNEGITKSIARCIAKECLLKSNVIIDDTNLSDSVVQSWKDLAKETNSKFEKVVLDTPMEECIKRDNLREKYVGENVIIGMAMQCGVYPTPKKGIIICDIDGILANASHRMEFIKSEKKDWKKFFSLTGEDKPRKEIFEMIVEFEKQGYEIFLVSGRPDNLRKETEEWLFENAKNYYFSCIKFYKALFMRPSNDKRDDTIIKKEIYDRYFKNYKIIKLLMTVKEL